MRIKLIVIYCLPLPLSLRCHVSLQMCLQPFSCLDQIGAARKLRTLPQYRDRLTVHTHSHTLTHSSFDCSKPKPAQRSLPCRGIIFILLQPEFLPPPTGPGPSWAQPAGRPVSQQGPGDSLEAEGWMWDPQVIGRRFNMILHRLSETENFFLFHFILSVSFQTSKRGKKKKQKLFTLHGPASSITGNLWSRSCSASS